MEKGYCEKCGELVEFCTKEKKEYFTVRNKEYSYTAIVPYCVHCNEEVTVNEITDENIKRLDESYRKEENIITTAQIEEVLRKYKIGKKPLSKLLGWGEVTISRFINNGDMPSKVYSDVLLKILNDSQYMKEIAKKNKDNITDIAYNKLMKSINDLKENKKNHIDTEIEIIAKYIIHQIDTTQLALQKMLYYAQGFYKAFTNNYLFNDDCQAWTHGPVYNTIYTEYKENGYGYIKPDDDYDYSDIISDDKKKLIDAIIKYFGYYNGRALEKMTHIEIPWMITRKGLKSDEPSKRIISKKFIKEYFNDVKEKFNMINYYDIKRYSMNMFNNIIE